MNFHPSYFGVFCFASSLIQVTTLRQYDATLSLLINSSTEYTRSIGPGCLAYLPKDPNDANFPAQFIFVEEKYPYYTEIKRTIISAGENTKGLKKVDKLVNSCDTIVKGMLKFFLSEITSYTTIGRYKSVVVEYNHVEVMVTFGSTSGYTGFVEILSEVNITCRDTHNINPSN